MKQRNSVASILNDIPRMILLYRLITFRSRQSPRIL